MFEKLIDADKMSAFHKPNATSDARTPPPDWVLAVGGVLLTIMVVTVLWFTRQPLVTSPVANSTTASRPTLNVSPTPPAATAVSRLKQLLEDVPNTLVVYPDNQRPDEFPPDTYTGSVSVIAVDTRATSCDAAKRVTYELLKNLYTDSSLRGSLEKVLITNPDYLRVSLGRIDGEGLTRKNIWSGVTNFYALLFDRFEGKPESVLDKDATWAESINGCR